MSKLIFMFLSILMGTISFLQADMIQASEGKLIDKLMQNERNCVLKIEGDKIFLQADKIFTTNKGIFLDINGLEYCPLPLLQSNENGCFLQIDLKQGSDLLQLAGKKSKGDCPNCEFPTNSYGRCTNSRCHFYGVKVL